MSHDEIQLNVMSLLDGELSGPARAAAEAHLRSCEPCQSMAKDFAFASATLKTPSVDGSDRFVWSVMSRVRALDSRPSSVGYRLVRRWLAPLSAAVAFGGYVVLLATPSAGGLSATDEVLFSEARFVMPSGWIVASPVSPDGYVLDDEGEE